MLKLSKIFFVPLFASKEEIKKTNKQRKKNVPGFHGSCPAVVALYFATKALKKQIKSFFLSFFLSHLDTAYEMQNQRDGL